MLRLIFRLSLVGSLAALVFFMFISPWQSQQVVEQFNDQLLEMKADAAIQAGYIQTMHEQRWGSHAFVHVLGLTLPRGKTEVRIRAPIKVYYGVRPKFLHARQLEQGYLVVQVDRVEVLNVETDLRQLEMQTSVGWARFDALSGDEARMAAKKSFELSKYKAAGKLLHSADVSMHVCMAVRQVAAALMPIKLMQVQRQDMPEGQGTQRCP